MMMVGNALTAATFIPRRWLGAALIAVGCLLGWSVARSFSEKRWGEDLVQSQADT
jgi:TRAP-type C4-dicarboxylate transport system permease small subunit